MQSPWRWSTAVGAGAWAFEGLSLNSTEFADWTACTVATKADVENHFNTHGTGEITEIKLMNGFGFIEYKDAMDARDVVPGTYSCLSCHLILQMS